MAKKITQQQGMILGLVVVLVAAAGWYWYSSSQTDLLTVDDTLITTPVERQQQKPDGFVDIFNDPDFLRLQDVERRPFILEPKGKDNPFQPFPMPVLPTREEATSTEN